MYNTNHSNVEKIMLLRENLKQIVRLIFFDIFVLIEFFLISLIHKIYDDCFFLFENLLSKSKQKKMINENESKLWIIIDKNHKKISIIDRFEIKCCREIFNIFIKTLINNKIIFVAIKIILRNVYAINYLMSNIMHFDKIAIQWCKKLNFFNSQSKHRITFYMKHFVTIRNKIEKIRFNFLFVHKLNDFRRLFVIIFKLQNTQKKWNVEFFFWRFEIDFVSKWNIIDLLTIDVEKFYMLFMKNKNLMLMNWMLQYLW